jgi:hypothetical protein
LGTREVLDSDALNQGSILQLAEKLSTKGTGLAVPEKPCARLGFSR